MNAAKRQKVANALMKECSRLGIPLPDLTKGAVLATVNGMDDYCINNATAMDAAIPQPARSSLPATTKALLYSRLMEERAKV